MCNCQNWRSYNFQIRSLDQIDYQLIESELSHKNPVMQLEVEGFEGVMVLIDRSIYAKANTSGKTKDIERDQQYNYSIKVELEKLIKLEETADDYGFVSKEVAKKMLKCVKRIRKAKWDEPFRAMVTVKKVDVGV